MNEKLVKLYKFLLLNYPNHKITIHCEQTDQSKFKFLQVWVNHHAPFMEFYTEAAFDAWLEKEVHD